jgi:hypothetical protein
MEYSKFATPDAFIREGFDLIVGPIGLPDDLRSALFADYAHAHKSGDPRAEGAAFAGLLSGINWRWPWFEEWHQRFTVLGAWPRMWRHFSAETEIGALRLLAHTLSRASVSARKRDDGLRLARYRNPQWTWGMPAPERMEFRFFRVVDEPQPVLDIIEHYIDAFGNGTGAWPPFFPGDRTSGGLSMALRRRVDNEAGGA